MVLSNINSLTSYLPELMILVMILIVFLYESFKSYRQYIFTVLSAGMISVIILMYLYNPSSNLLFEGMLVNDSLSIFLKWILVISTFSVIIISKNDNSILDDIKSEYYAMLLIILLGMFAMVSATNLLMVYLAIEMVSIPSYIIAGISKNDKESNEAALKYVIYGSFASGIMLFGLSFLYGLTGTTDIYTISNQLTNNENSLLIYLSMIFILVGFGYKISMVPFHYWTPDVYQGAPITVTTFLSVAPKAAGFAILIRFFYSIFVTNGAPIIEWTNIIAIFSALTMTVGNILALKQTNIKRLLAYSSISHVGFMLIALSIVSIDSVTSVLFYLVFYMFMNLSAFFVAIYMSNAYQADNIDDWNGLGLKMPVISIFMVLSLASLAGLPPTSGFIGKVYVLRNLFADQQYLWLGIVAIINTVVSLYYYFNIVKAMYFMENDSLEYKSADKALYFFIIIFSAQNILFYLYWSPLWNYLKSIVESINIL
tara:strand:+ start:12013 stop:13464 length:1452 start_codon:yes stop_codon:yes gene_type:complete